MFKGIAVAAVCSFVGAFSATSAPNLHDNGLQAEPLGTEWDCVHACNDCQKACQSKPAGSEQTDCMRSCTASAAGCCAGYGKKPPQGLSCACM